MKTRSLLATGATALALLAAVPATAQAATLEGIDRSLFDPTPETSASSWHLDGATAGELGGALDLHVVATDGTFPTAPGTCEPVDVQAVLQVSPGELLSVRTTGEACAHVVDGSLSVNASFGRGDVTYSGTAHKKVKVVGDGLIAARTSFLGGQASIGMSVRW